jgi:hypothetical protein
MGKDSPEQTSVPPARQPYVKPVLQQWGRLEDLTKGGGGKMMEPGMGAPATRM